MSEHVNDELIDLGSASELTLGSPEASAWENLTMKDFRD